MHLYEMQRRSRRGSGQTLLLPDFSEQNNLSTIGFQKSNKPDYLISFFTSQKIRDLFSNPLTLSY
jgi:hypothetical protein